MVKESDLRVGNFFIGYDDKIFPWKLTDFNLLCESDLSIDEVIKSPVLLTNDILVSSGGKIVPGTTCIIVDRFRLLWREDYKYWYVMDDMTFAYISKVTSVHEWQNLYYSLNGQELNINLHGVLTGMMI